MLPWQHGLIDCSNLVRQRINDGCVDRQHRIKKVGQTYPVGLGDQAKKPAVAIKAPRAARFYDLNSRFVMTIDKFVRHSDRQTSCR